MLLYLYMFERNLMVLYAVMYGFSQGQAEDGTFNLTNVANAIKFSQESPSIVVRIKTSGVLLSLQTEVATTVVVILYVFSMSLL